MCAERYGGDILFEMQLLSLFGAITIQNTPMYQYLISFKGNIWPQISLRVSTHSTDLWEA